MRGGRKVLAPPLRWRVSLLACLRIAWLCWSSQITSRGLYEPLSISCCSCCESLRILADRTGSFSFCFSESLQIHADLHRSFCRGAATWVPTLPSPSDVANLVVSMGGSGEYFSTDLVQCDGASRQLLVGVVLAHGVAMDTSLPLAWSVQAPCQHQFASSSIGDEFNQIMQVNSPVVPASVISLRCLTTSIRFDSLAVAARQRIILAVSGVGCFKSVSFKCRSSFSWRTISSGSYDTSDSTMLPGRARELSPSKEIQRIEFFLESFVIKRTVDSPIKCHCLANNLEMKCPPSTFVTSYKMLPPFPPST